MNQGRNEEETNAKVVFERFNGIPSCEMGGGASYTPKTSLITTLSLRVDLLIFLQKTTTPRDLTYAKLQCAIPTPLSG
jgi:hypothetical protein